ncbi:hypothetical protein [Cricetibacter osteomyelitidis]|nr:hypothetical protein [Cricetibacter osteomyelitidis]
MIVSDYTMWLPMLGRAFLFKYDMYKKSSSILLKQYLVDFMNPETQPERIASMMQALESKPSILEYLERFLFGWIDGGLFCRKLPKDSRLEVEIEKYFAEEAPKIKALPSCRMSMRFNEKLTWKTGYFIIESVEDNIKAGFDKVPCPNLYEYPENSLHFNSQLYGWGNEKEMERVPSQKPRFKARKKKRMK